MRHLQLLVSLYNQCYAFIHFIWKVLATVCVVLFVSAGVILLHRNFYLAIVYLFFGLDSSGLYCVLFHKAFAIPLIMKKFKVNMVNIAKLNFKDDDEIRADLCRRIRSIPAIAIKVGQFHTFERMSTPNFLGFCAKNVIRLLIILRNR